jgi:hypothetical protein
MIGKIYEQLINWNKLSIFSTAIFALFLLVGCATGGNYGKLDWDRDLEYMFINYEVLPDHRYYSTGSYAKPEAILTVHRDYELDNSSNLWRETLNVDYAQIRKWMDNISFYPHHWPGGGYYAAYILDPNGKKVGTWYSFQPFATVKFLGENNIQVYPPNSGRKHFGRWLK